MQPSKELREKIKRAQAEKRAHGLKPHSPFVTTDLETMGTCAVDVSEDLRIEVANELMQASLDENWVLGR